MFSARARTIFQYLRDASHVLFIPHQQPDGDALGAVTALAHYRETIGKPYSIFCHTPYSSRFGYLPHIDKFSNDPAPWQNPPWDLIIVCDSGDLVYAGVDKYIADMQRPVPILNIDHHVSNTRFGDHALVVDTASSTCEVLYHFFKTNHIEIDNTMAQSLLTGLMYDTDNFTNGATSRLSLEIGSDLVRRGADLAFIRHALFQNKTIPTLQLWGQVLARLTKIPELDLTYTFITREDLRDYDLEDKDAEGIANFLNSLGETAITLFFKEMSDGQIKASFRTTAEIHDVAKLSKLFGGGGHKKAAGFTVQGPMIQAIEQVLTTLRSNR